MDEAPRFSEPALFHCGWQELVDAAEAAACRAGQRLAARCSIGELRRTGRAWVHVEPLDSPVASWLYRSGYGSCSASQDGVMIPVELGVTELHPAAEAAQKARSLLVAQAYANAYCSVLAEEAGVTATPVIERDRPSVVRTVITNSVLDATATSREAVRDVAPEIPRPV